MVETGKLPIVRKFVGRKLELNQFASVIKPRPALLRYLIGPNINVKSQVFLPFGIGGIGKTELSRKCLECAEDAGWATLEIDWDRADTRPNDELQLLNIIAEHLKKVYGNDSIAEFLKREKQIQYVEERIQHLKIENQEKWLSFVDAIQDIGGGVSGNKDIDIGSVTKGVGKLINMGAAKVAQAEDRFSDWLVSTGKIKADEGSLYKRKDIFLASKLVNALTECASRKPLAILFDTCEMLSFDLEEWLRDIIVCPLCQAGKPLVFIVSGQNNQYLERRVEAGLLPIFHFR